MRKKNKLICFAIIAVALAIIYFGSELLSLIKLGLTDVYIAKVSIPSRTEILDDYLDVIKVPKAYINDQIIRNKNEIIGKYSKLGVYIPKGSIIYYDQLESKEKMSDLLHLGLNNDEVTFDLLAKDIKVNPAHLLKGMNVDLYLTINKKEVISDLLISGARIIGLYDINNKEIINNSSDRKLGTISLAIKRDMVSYLNKAIAVGEVSLIVGNNLYDDNYKMYLNSSSQIIEYLS